MVKIKILKKILKLNQGLSLVEMLISAGLIAGAGVIVFKSKSLVENTKKEKERVFSMQALNDDIVNTTGRVLTGTENQNGKRVKGLCSIVYTVAKSYGVAEVYANIKVFKDIFTKEVWEDSYLNWKVKDDPRCKKDQEKSSVGVRQCFSFHPESINTGFSEQKLKDMDVASYVEVIPVGINPYKSENGKTFYELTTSDKGDKETKTKIDVKNVAFKIRSKVFYNWKKIPQVKELKDIIWLPNVGTCDGKLATSDNTHAALSLSGLGLSDPKGETVYNRAGFASNKEDPIKFIWRKDTAQSGVLLPGNFIKTNPERNIYGSCNEIKYRCPKVGSKKREYGPINLRVDMALVQNSMLGYNSVLDIRPSFRIKKGTQSSVVPPGNVSMIMDQNETLRQGQSTTIRGGHTLAVRVQDSNGRNDSMCRQICQESNNYNGGTQNITNSYAPWLSVNIYEHNMSLKSSSNQALGCTACYMKNCSQFGLGTFGPMKDMPSQPQDSSVPECHRYENNAIKFDPYFNMKHRFNFTSSGKCIKARLAEQGLVYRTEDCGKRLPVMCYNFGRFFLAQNVIGNNQGLAKVNFDNAPRRCFATGRERSNASDLSEFMGNLQSLPNSGGTIDFVNLANQGSFIAPQLESDIREFESWMEDSPYSSQNTWFWVGMTRAGNKSIRALPLVNSSSSGDRHSLFYSPRRNLVYNDYNFGHGVASSTTENTYLLTHHIKFRGLIPARKDYPRGTKSLLPFICRYKDPSGGLFLSKTKSATVSQGKSICQSEGGVFLPPNTLTQWIYALNLINPFDSNHSFPNPNQRSSSQLPFAWVGMQTSGPSYSSLRKAQLVSEFPAIGRPSAIYNLDFPLKKTDPKLISNLGIAINPRLSFNGRKVVKTRSVRLKPRASITYRLSPYGDQTVVLNPNYPPEPPPPEDPAADDFDPNANDIFLTVEEIAAKLKNSSSKIDLKENYTTQVVSNDDDDKGKGKGTKTVSVFNGYNLRSVDEDVVFDPNNPQAFEFVSGHYGDLGFSKGTVEAPRFKYLCFNSEKKLHVVNYETECKTSGGYVIEFADIQSLDFQIAWHLTSLSSGIFRFP